MERRETFQKRLRSAIGGVIIRVFEITTHKETGECYLGELQKQLFSCRNKFRNFFCNLPLRKPKQKHFPSSFVTKNGSECLQTHKEQASEFADQTERWLETNHTGRSACLAQKTTVNRSRTSEFLRVLETQSSLVRKRNFSQ